MREIEDDHIGAAKESIGNIQIVNALERDIKDECEELIKVLESAQHLEEVSSRAENKIISEGEKLACRYLAALLEDRGVPAQYVDLSNVIKQYNVSVISNNVQYQELAEALG